MRTLIVDDCALSRQLLIISIEEYSEIDVAANGKEAIDLVKQAMEMNENYNLICMDLNMPVMDGHETMQAIREMEAVSKTSKAKFFMITSSNCPDDMIKAITEGECDDYIMKPVMRKSIRKLLKKHALVQ
jgi:two-component system, chemotaxis family, chemotaxis protein CheY